MDDGLPDEARFRDTIGNVILDASEAHEGRLFVFGEMVALLRAHPRCPLCPPVKHDAAVHVERYFNNLLRAFHFHPAVRLSAVAPSRPPTTSGTFHEVCALHTEVLPAESYDPNTQRESLQRTDRRACSSRPTRSAAKCTTASWSSRRCAKSTSTA